MYNVINCLPNLHCNECFRLGELLSEVSGGVQFELVQKIGRNKFCSLAQTALKVEPALSKFEELSQSMRTAR